MKKIALIFSVILIIFSILAWVLLSKNAEFNYNLGMENWRTHISTIAFSRKANINNIVSKKETAIKTIAESADISSFLESQSHQSETTNRLQNYLVSIGNLYNINSTDSGLAIVNNSGASSIKTASFALREKQGFFVLDNTLYWYGIAPIHSHNTKQKLGEVHGQWLLDKSFYTLLNAPKTTSKTDYSLFMIEEDGVFYSIGHEGDIIQHDKEAFPKSLYNPGSVVAEGTETRLLHRISRYPGYLVHSVETAEIAKPLEQARSNFKTIGFMVITMSLITSLAGWLFATQKQEATKASYQRKLVDKLVAMVDSRDHHSANHSENVAEMARSIGKVMSASPEEQRTAAIAGRLMNIGKVSLDTSILAKTGKLTADEKRQISDAFRLSEEIVHDIDFGVPVQETLIQSRIDFAEAKNQPLAARIIKVANAYVAMSSPRAYRKSLVNADILSELDKESGKRFDPAVIDALRVVVVQY